MFTENQQQLEFSWDMLGDIETGRPTLGMSCPVTAYRMLQKNISLELIKQFGNNKCNEIFKNAGYSAGKECANAVLNCNTNPETFLIHLQILFKEYNIGIIKVEKADFENLEMILDVKECLECAGMLEGSASGCKYFEGFFSGIMEMYFGQSIEVKETDCWSKGHRFCRFSIEALM